MTHPRLCQHCGLACEDHLEDEAGQAVCPGAPRFRFTLGQVVCWLEHPDVLWVICQRRWTERPILDPMVEYLLGRRESPAAARDVWVFEDELAPWEAPQP